MAAKILGHLQTVAAERAQWSVEPRLHAAVIAVKAYQQRRFEHTYKDLLRSSRYGAASRFFLDELYGPNDFALRDAQFARVVPALVRLFPSEIVDTVGTLAELHALSETLDTAMATQLENTGIQAVDYVRAWQATGRPGDRQAQIALTLDVAERLDRLTRRALLRNSLRLMRGPARAAGMSELQRFLETGFDTFREMNGAEEFVKIVDTRERGHATALFDAELDRVNAAPGSASIVQALASLP